MKNILLSVVVVAALVSAGVGGTLADFSDYEVSEDNFFSVGALDLTVSDYLGREYNGDIVPAYWQIEDAYPCCDKSVFLDLENWGQGFQLTPHVYLHVKNMECYSVMPKLVYAYVLCDPVTKEVIDCVLAAGLTQDEIDKLLAAGYTPKNEPECVAECGGIAGEDADGNPVEVPGIGCYGECCQLAEHIGVLMWVAGPWPHEDKPARAQDVPAGAWRAVTLPDPNGDGVTKLDELECVQFDLGELPNCKGIWVHVSLHLQQILEEDMGLDCFPAGSKWEYWPTNALQKDGVRWDMAFELLQY